MSDPTKTEAWRRGQAAARAALGEKSTGRPPVPTVRSLCPWIGPDGEREAVSNLTYPITLSPALKSWPIEVREWLFVRTTIMSLNDGPSRHMITREQLGLPDDGAAPDLEAARRAWRRTSRSQAPDRSSKSSKSSRSPGSRRS